MSGAAGRRPASRPTLFVLSLGHGGADLCSGALFALLPFLVVERHYSYAAAGVFALTASVASALFQPLVGAHGDRSEAHWLLPGGLVLSGLGIGAVGFATSYPLTLLAVAVCSAGVAAYHPEGARWARHASSSRVTADMSVFSVGGGVGFALGPLVVAAALAPLGLHGTPIIALIPVAAAAGTLLGGFGAQRLGRRFVLVVPQLALVLAQEYLPAHMGLATGLTIGVCGGAGGLIVAALGLLGDAAGPSSVLYALAALPLVVAVLASRLPRPAAAPPETVWSLRVEAEH